MSADICGGEKSRVVELGGMRGGVCVWGGGGGGGVGGALIQLGVVAPVSMDQKFEWCVLS